MKIEIHEELKSFLRVGVLRLEGLALPDDDGAALWAIIDERCTAIAAEHEGKSSGQVPEVGETRKLYRAVGLDPTKTRPSSEALLRRVIKGKGLYRVHPLVDMCNLVSLESQLSLGLYDEARIAGDAITVRLGEPGWSYEGIRRGPINVGGRLCVVDAEGPFGSPTADSQRTCIEGAVERALVVVFQHTDGEIARLEAALYHARDLAAEFLRAETTQMYTL